MHRHLSLKFYYHHSTLDSTQSITASDSRTTKLTFTIWPTQPTQKLPDYVGKLFARGQLTRLT